MFLGGDTNITAGSGRTFTLDRAELASIAAGLGDGYFGDKEFWREILINFEAGNVYDLEETLLVNGDFETDLSGWDVTLGTWTASGIYFPNNGYIEQYIVAEVGETYTASMDVASHVGIGCSFSIRNGDTFELIEGTYCTSGKTTFEFVAPVANVLVSMGALSGSEATVSNVLVAKQIPYQKQPMKQRKTLVFRDTDTSTISFSEKAMIGEWPIRNVTILDKDHGKIVLEPSDIPEASLYKLTIQ